MERSTVAEIGTGQIGRAAVPAGLAPQFTVISRLGSSLAKAFVTNGFSPLFKRTTLRRATWIGVTDRHDGEDFGPRRQSEQFADASLVVHSRPASPQPHRPCRVGNILHRLRAI